ncbi:MAG: hypothetical protein K2M19_04850 [Muribaculaceae bacterium]|nr:hypothetical protein [Muribaculaceae bacterium]
MKTVLSIIAAIAVSLAASAQVNISKVDKVSPNDEIFMDMAVSAAQNAVESGQKANGAVLVLNGAWKATGLPGANNTPEAEAIAKTKRTTIPGAVIFTVNQPTPAAVNAAGDAGIEAIYFVNSADAAVAAGIYSKSDYAGEVNPDVTVAVLQMTYAPAAALLK